MKVGSQAKVMSKNNPLVMITKGQKFNLPMPHNFANATYNLEHKWMILQIQHSKLDATKIDTESAIFAHVMNELKHANGFLDNTNGFRHAT